LSVTVRARKSELGIALVNMGDVIDYVTYAQELAQANIKKIEFS
jgi:hypothetical protein